MVEEYFSYTCSHCAKFAAETFPQIKSALVDTGRVRWVFRDFPLDGLGLLVASLAMELNSSRYVAFQEMMLKRQESWAVPQAEKSLPSIKVLAALVGIPAATFDAIALSEHPFRKAVIEERIWGTQEYSVDSTPSFVLTHPGKPGFEKRVNMPFEEFMKWVA